MGRKNKRKKSAYERKLRINKDRYISHRASNYDDLPNADQNNVASMSPNGYPSRREVWFAELGTHEGVSVQDGYRPILIVSNDTANSHSDTLTVVPLTSKMKKQHLPTHVMLRTTECDFLQNRSMVLAEQITTIGKNQLRNYVGRVIDEQKI